ncbi:MAG: hypothetical protein NC924_05345, partial [Candidatus Omnitrophica bacterium]|nr:hypothetical protein [Candidatus Omnitrophota bacterium]
MQRNTIFLKTTALILVQALVCTGSPSCADARRSSGDAGKNCLSPALSLQKAQVQDALLNAAAAVEINNLIRFLDNWTAISDERARTLRLEEIQFRAEKEFASIEQESAQFVSRARELSAQNSAQPGREHFIDLFRHLQTHGKSRRLLKAWISNFLFFSCRDRVVFPEKLKVLEKKYDFGSGFGDDRQNIDETTVFEFYENLYSDDQLRPELEASLAQYVDHFAAEQARDMQRKTEIFQTLVGIEKQDRERWIRNDITLVDEAIQNIREVLRSYGASGFEQWIQNALPDWPQAAHALAKLIEALPEVPVPYAVMVLEKMQRVIQIVDSFYYFGDSSRKEAMSHELAVLMNVLLRKMPLVHAGKDIACFYIKIDRRASADSKHPGVAAISEALRQGKEVVCLGDIGDIRSVMLHQVRNPRSNLEVDLMNAKVLLISDVLFGGNTPIDALHGFLQRQLKTWQNPMLMSLPVFIFLHDSQTLGINPHDYVRRTARDDRELITAEFCRQALTRNHETFSHRSPLDIECVLPYLSAPVIARLTDALYRSQDNEGLATLLWSLDDHYEARMIARKALFKAAFRQEGIDVREKTLRILARDFGMLRGEEKEPILNLIGANYEALSLAEKRNLVRYLQTFDLSGFEVSDFPTILHVVRRDREALRGFMAYGNAFMELQSLDAIDRELLEMTMANVWSGDDSAGDYLRRDFLRNIPCREKTAGAGEWLLNRLQTVEGRRTVDYRGETAGLMVVLDNHGRHPGENGRTIFTNLREDVHSNPEKNYTDVFYRLLCYWKDLDVGVLRQLPSVYQNTFVEDEDKQHHHWAVNFLFQKARDRVSSTRATETDFAAFIRGAGRESLLDAVDSWKNELSRSLESERDPAVRWTLQNKMKALEKVAWTVIAYQTMAQKFGEDRQKNSETIAAARLGHFTEIDRLRDEFMVLIAEPGGDVMEILAQYTALRKAVYTVLKSSPALIGEDWSSYERDVRARVELQHFDFALEVYGRSLVQQACEEILSVRDNAGLERAARILSGLAQNFICSGMGTAAVEEFSQELNQGELYLSQLLNMVDSLEFELNKIFRGVSESYRGKIAAAAVKIQIKNLKVKYKDIVNMVHPGYLPNDRISPETAAQIEEIVLGEMFRSATYPTVKNALLQLSRVLEQELRRQGDIRLRRGSDVSAQSVDRLFRRFPAVEKNAAQGILSWWGKKPMRVARMAEEGLPVPRGVIISALLCHRPDILEDANFTQLLEREVEHLQTQAAHPKTNLFLFARSGAAYSLPGLLVTIPNLGMNDQAVEQLARQTNDRWFAYDAYGNFLRAYGQYVLQIPSEKFQDILNLNLAEKPSTADGMRAVVEQYKTLIAAERGAQAVPSTLKEQVMACIKAIYESWNALDARAYRQRHTISEHWGTAAILQEAKFGNKPGFSGAGAATFRFDADGLPFIEGRFRFRSQGEALMTGASGNYVVISRAEAHAGEFSLEGNHPQLYTQLLDLAGKASRLFGQPQRVEFTLEQGMLYTLQSSDSDEYDDADLPEYAVAIDRYEHWLHVQEYAPPASVNPARAQERLHQVMAVL